MFGRALRLRILLLVLSCVAVEASVHAAAPLEAPAPPKTQVLRSPDESIEVSVSVSGPLTYSVQVDGKPVLSASTLGRRPVARSRWMTNALVTLDTGRSSKDLLHARQLGRGRCSTATATEESSGSGGAPPPLSHDREPGQSPAPADFGDRDLQERRGVHR